MIELFNQNNDSEERNYTFDISEEDCYQFRVKGLDGNGVESTWSEIFKWKKTCSSINLELCVAKEECEEFEGYWYEGKCNEIAECTMSDPSSCTQEECRSLDFEDEGNHWYDNNCNLIAKCTIDYLDSCTQEQCRELSFGDRGNHWYEDKCHKKAECTKSYPIYCSEEECEALFQDGRSHWYNNQCLPFPV